MQIKACEVGFLNKVLIITEGLLLTEISIDKLTLDSGALSGAAVFRCSMVPSSEEL